MSHSDYCRLLHRTTNSFPDLTQGKPYVSTRVYRHFGHLDCLSVGVDQSARGTQSHDTDGCECQSHTHETATRH